MLFPTTETNTKHKMYDKIYPIRQRMCMVFKEVKVKFQYCAGVGRCDSNPFCQSYFQLPELTLIFETEGCSLFKAVQLYGNERFGVGKSSVRNSEQIPTCRCPQANKADRQSSSLLNSTHFNIIPYQLLRLLSSLLPSRFLTKPCRNFSSSPGELHALPI